MMDNGLEKLMTVVEVADYLRLNRFTVYRMIARRELPAIKVTDQWRFRQRDLEAWLEQRSQHSKGHGA